jgi:integrase
MPRTPKGTLPKLRLHKPSGRAVVTIKGKDHYCGPWGSEQATQRYARLIAEFRADQPSPDARAVPGGLTINEIVLAFLQAHDKHYRRNGVPTGELDNVKDAVGPLCRLYGHVSGMEFDASVAMEAIREDMIASGSLARTTINARINRIRRVLRWGVGKRMVAPAALAFVDAKVFPGLQAGRRADVREPNPVLPVGEEQLQAAAPFMPRQVAAMAWIIRLTICRPEDVVIMRGRDLTFGDLHNAEDRNWYYRPGSHLPCGAHKNAWRGQDRVVPLGPKAQEILRPFLSLDSQGNPTAPDNYLFSPADAAKEIRARRAVERKTKRTPSELRKKPKRNPKVKPGARYTVQSLRQAIKRACVKAGIDEWTPNRLRHGWIDEIVDDPRYGLEQASALAGHARIDTTQIYRRNKAKLAAQIAAEEG